MFRRFYRLDQSRSSERQRTGLEYGVGGCLRCTTATIELHNNHPGLRMVITLPLTAQPRFSAPAAIAGHSNPTVVNMPVLVGPTVAETGGEKNRGQRPAPPITPPRSPLAGGSPRLVLPPAGVFLQLWYWTV